MNERILLPYTKLPEDFVENVFDIDAPEQPAKGMSGGTKVLRDQLLALPLHAAVQRSCRFAQQGAVPLPSDQSALARPEIIFGVPGQRRRQLLQSVAAGRRNPEISAAPGLPPACRK